MSIDELTVMKEKSLNIGVYHRDTSKSLYSIHTDSHSHLKDELRKDSIPYADDVPSLPASPSENQDWGGLLDEEKLQLSCSQSNSEYFTPIPTVDGQVWSQDVSSEYYFSSCAPDGKSTTSLNRIIEDSPTSEQCGNEGTHAPLYFQPEDVRCMKAMMRRRCDRDLGEEDRFPLRVESRTKLEDEGLNDSSVRQFYNYMPPIYKVWGEFDKRGGELFLPPTGLMLSVPEYALKPEKSQEIFLAVSGEKDDVPLLAPTERLATWIVCVGPHGLQFQQPVMLRLPHCHTGRHGVTKVTVYCSQTGLGGRKFWKKMPLVSEHLLCIVRPEWTLLLMQHFTWYTITMESTDDPENPGEPGQERADAGDGGNDVGGDEDSGQAEGYSSHDNSGYENNVDNGCKRDYSNDDTDGNTGFTEPTDWHSDVGYPDPANEFEDVTSNSCDASQDYTSSGISTSSYLQHRGHEGQAAGHARSDRKHLERRNNLERARGSRLRSDLEQKAAHACCDAFAYCTPLTSQSDVTVRLYLLPSNTQDNDKIWKNWKTG
ncbi:uncharacterized protein [Ptychodera flava]|uniref:uncharacterized protein n=1 Tax=Ptychodera flava TaxID=63121 RepID=UPI00396A6502